MTTTAVTLGLAMSPLLLPVHPAAAGAPEGCATATGVYQGPVPWPQQRLGLTRVWPLTTGAGVTVAVVATGVEADHGQFGPDQVRKGADVRTSAAGSTADADCDGRGTFAAGLVAARPITGTTFAGMAPDATILPVRYTGSRSDGQSEGDAKGLARGIRYAIRAEADVIVVPTADAADTPQLRAAVEAALEADIVVVAAGTRPQQGVTYPTAYPGVLAVAAVGPDGAPMSTADRGRHIVVAAPGAGLVGPAPAQAGHRWPVESPGMAAALVGGVAALVRSHRPALTAPQVLRRIRDTADPLRAGGGADLGAGLVNPYAAVTSEVAGQTAATGAVPAGAPVRLMASPDAGASERHRRAVVLLVVTAGAAALIAIAGLLLRRRVSGGPT